MPTFRDIILAAGALGEADQQNRYDALLSLLTEEIDAKIKDLGTDEGLRSAIEVSALPQGLVRAEVRQYLKAQAPRVQ